MNINIQHYSGKMTASEKFIAVIGFTTLLGLILTPLRLFPIVPMFGLAIYQLVKTFLFKKWFENYSSINLGLDIFIAFILILSFFAHSGFVNFLSFFAIVYMVFKVLFGFTSMK